MKIFPQIQISKKLLSGIYNRAYDVNLANLSQALSRTGPHPRLLDVGCWDGLRTLDWAKAASSRKVFGIESVPSAAALAANRGITVYSLKADRQKWPIPDASLDCVVSNQVVEHLVDLDHFFSQAYRVLKPGGVIITSTNNLCSFHNLAALVFGWAPFDFANCSYHASSLGNPFSLHRQEKQLVQPTWTHKCIYTAYWLNQWQQLYGLKPMYNYGAGLYPFSPRLGRIFKRYSAFITLVSQK